MKVIEVMRRRHSNMGGSGEGGRGLGDIKDIRVRMRPGSRERLSLRVMLENPLTGEHLCRNSIFLLGTRCRVSQYRPPRRPQQPCAGRLALNLRYDSLYLSLLLSVVFFLLLIPIMCPIHGSMLLILYGTADSVALLSVVLVVL